MLRLTPTIRAALRPILCQQSLQRALHRKPAKFITVDNQGSPSTQCVDVWLGDNDDSFVLIPPNVGHVLQGGTSGGPRAAETPPKLSLTFHHESRSSMHGESRSLG